MFKGFTDATTDFLWNIRFNNEREWFNEHKQEYIDHLWEPFKALAHDVYDRFMEDKDDLIVNLHISRIYRDARRLHGRGPYKDHLWFSIRPENDEWHERPVFWFEIAPEGYSYGLGVYSPNPAQMTRFRKEIDERPNEILALAEEFDKQDRFFLEGDEYARKKGNPQPPLDKWYNRKSINFHCDRGLAKPFYSKRLVDEVVEGYNMLLPYYKYFAKLADRIE